MAQVQWEMLHPQMTVDHLGFIPHWLDDRDPLPPEKQIEKYYISGWPEFKGFKMNTKTGVMSYPEDPPVVPLAKAQLRDDTIYFYPSAWVSVVRKDGTFTVARID